MPPTGPVPTPPPAASPAPQPPVTDSSVPITKVEPAELRRVSQSWISEGDDIASLDPSAAVSPGGDAAREAEMMVAALDAATNTLAENWRSFGGLLSDAASEYEETDGIQADRFDLPER